MAEQTGEVKNQEWRGKVGKMMEDEFAAFLSGNPFCRIGCVDEEGWPYVVPCWFEYSDGGFYIIPRAKSAWARYISEKITGGWLTAQPCITVYVAAKVPS